MMENQPRAGGGGRSFRDSSLQPHPVISVDIQGKVTWQSRQLERSFSIQNDADVECSRSFKRPFLTAAPCHSRAAAAATCCSRCACRARRRCHRRNDLCGRGCGCAAPEWRGGIIFHGKLYHAGAAFSLQVGHEPQRRIDTRGHPGGRVIGAVNDNSVAARDGAKLRQQVARLPVRPGTPARQKSRCPKKQSAGADPEDKLRRPGMGTNEIYQFMIEHGDIRTRAAGNDQEVRSRCIFACDRGNDRHAPVRRHRQHVCRNQVDLPSGKTAQHFVRADQVEGTMSVSMIMLTCIP